MIFEINKNLAEFDLNWQNAAKSDNYKIVLNTDRAFAKITDPDSSLSYYAASVLIAANLKADPSERILVIISDDALKNYLWFIFANGGVVPYTEGASADLDKVNNRAIQGLSDKDNIDRIVVLSDIESVLIKGNYDTLDRSHINAHPTALLRKKGHLRAVPLAVAALILSLAGWGAYAYYTPAEPVVEIDIKYKKTTRDYTAFYTGCVQALAQLWPISPEWQQTQEGCIGDPGGLSNTILPRVSYPYVFRAYKLDASWNAFLATEAGRAVANLRPNATIIITGKTLVTYSTLPVDQMDRSDDFTAPTGYSTTIDSLFLGALDPYQINSKSPGGTAFKTTFDIETTISNLGQLNITPTSIVWDSALKKTHFTVKPLAIKTVTVRENEDQGG